MTTNLTYTAGDIATAALRKCGVTAVDRAATSDEMDTALVTFNAMLKALQIPSITMWKLATGSVTLLDATLSYPIAVRPLELNVVNWRSTDGRDLPMLRLTRDEYQELPDKDAIGTPTQFYYHRLRETATLFVWPVQAVGDGTIEWDGKAEIDDINATGDTLDVPAEWYEAIIYQLADRLCDDFPISPDRAARIRQRAEVALGLAQHSGRESVYFMPETEAG